MATNTMTQPLVAMFDEIVTIADTLLVEGGINAEQNYHAYVSNHDDYSKKLKQAELEIRHLNKELYKSHVKMLKMENTLRQIKSAYEEKMGTISQEDKLIQMEEVVVAVLNECNDQDENEKLLIQPSLDDAMYDSTCSALSASMYSRPSDTNSNAGRFPERKLTKQKHTNSDEDFKSTVLTNRIDKFDTDDVDGSKTLSVKTKYIDLSDVALQNGHAPSLEISKQNPEVCSPSLPTTHQLLNELPMKAEGTAGPSGLSCQTKNLPPQKMRPHTFVKKFIALPEKCVCKKNIQLETAVRCQSCRNLCHTRCKGSLPLPCIPYVSIPKRKQLDKYKLTEYTPTVAPMVPAIIVHCIYELDRRGLTDVDLYKKPGDPEVVQYLNKRFLEVKCNPLLTELDVYSLCEMVTSFLGNLEEPLLTTNLREEFLEADVRKRRESSFLGDTHVTLYNAISHLPQPNRDTLIFLMLHLQRVVNCCRDNKIQVNYLAKIFAPMLVGLDQNTSAKNEERSDLSTIRRVVVNLLELDSAYYSGFHTSFAESSERSHDKPMPARFFNMCGPSKKYTKLAGAKYFFSPRQAK